MANHNPQKLTDELVMNIKAQIAAGIKQRYLAMVNGVSQPTISQINTGKIWKNKANI
jgi:predicted XRE-type DNA-binding protein